MRGNAYPTLSIMKQKTANAKKQKLASKKLKEKVTEIRKDLKNSNGKKKGTKKEEAVSSSSSSSSLLILL